MINYLKSESYRLLRKKGPYLTSMISLLLIAAASALLYFFGQSDPNFPYATSKFFYSNVISGGVLIILVGSLYNLALTGQDMSLIKQSISFGISRSVIFWSKLLLTLSYFLLICVVGILFVIVLGENLLLSDDQSVRNLLIACVNMVPIVLSGFFLTHTLKMLKVGDIYLIFTLLFMYGFSGTLLRYLLRPIAGLDALYHYAPSTLLSDNLMDFVNDSVHFGSEYWITGTVISGIALLIGAKWFAKQNID
ncbi:ABC transporter permease [Oceanobacillus bengalensis]|uniref:ABC transporter permease n=1 Tax=Oceanobacillus bengalensis TaxID=1435466 RepID=A0A494YS88_9BACI|nr:ABC transporter permease [Oceanobacillus bengalensis]RKQ12493.1 ABC transporter permease [Oceanobacillus bengalensis]